MSCGETGTTVTSVNVDAVIESAANEVIRRFRGFTERDDLIQEGYMWTVLHPFRMKTYTEDENWKRAEYRLRVDVMSAMDRYARQQKASSLGYDVADEYAYGLAQVVNLLPAALAGDYERPVEASEGPSARTDPAEGGNYTTMVLDVALAWRQAALDDGEREMVTAYCVEGLTAEELGERMGLSRQAANTRVRKALKRIVAELGGENPKGCPYDCECHDGRLRQRPGVHSEISGANQLAT